MSEERPSFRKLIERVCYHRNPREVFDAFVRLSACGVACGRREADYLEEAKRWTSEELKAMGEAFGALVLEMDEQPFTDLLGGYYMEATLSAKGAQRGGEFHTPRALCEAIAEVTWNGGAGLPAEGPIRVVEPACGAGAMILAFAKVVPDAVRRRLRVTATDVNRTACDMTFINTTLWGIATRVVHGNTISGERWGVWENVHWTGLFAAALEFKINNHEETKTTDDRARGDVAQPEDKAASDVAGGAAPDLAGQVELKLRLL